MKPHRMIALVLLVALLVTAVTPARAEAMEVGTILMIAGAVVVVVILVAYLIVANTAERRRAAADLGVGGPDMAPHTVAFVEVASAP